MNNKWAESHARKRGGWYTHVALDASGAEAMYAREIGVVQTPEEFVDRRSVQLASERTRACLHEDYA